MKLNIEFYLVLVLCLIFACIFICNILKFVNREGMENNTDEKTVMNEPTKKKVKTVSPQ
jgi:hypothetical protein